MNLNTPAVQASSAWRQISRRRGDVTVFAARLRDRWPGAPVASFSRAGHAPPLGTWTNAPQAEHPARAPARDTDAEESRSSAPRRWATEVPGDTSAVSAAAVLRTVADVSVLQRIRSRALPCVATTHGPHIPRAALRADTEEQDARRAMDGLPRTRTRTTAAWCR